MKGQRQQKKTQKRLISYRRTACGKSKPLELGFLLELSLGFKAVDYLISVKGVDCLMSVKGVDVC